MKKVLLLSLCVAVYSANAQSNKDAGKFASTITQKDLRDQLTIIASDEMEGRETATPGQKKAAAYIEEQFKKLGLKPGNGNSYQQKYPVYQDELKSASLSLYNFSFEYGKHFSANLSSSVNGNWNLNNIAYVAYGISDKERDDYKDVDVLKKFINPNGRMLSRKRTGTVAKNQRTVSLAIKRARFMGLLPFIAQ